MNFVFPSMILIGQCFHVKLMFNVHTFRNNFWSFLVSVSIADFKFLYLYFSYLLFRCLNIFFFFLFCKHEEVHWKKRKNKIWRREKGFGVIKRYLLQGSTVKHRKKNHSSKSVHTFHCKWTWVILMINPGL